MNNFKNKKGKKMNPSYYAVIPANVRYDKRLTPRAILLYGEITALCNKDGYCWARNKYFAELYSVSITSVSTWVSQLEKYGYIIRDIVYKDNSKEVDKRYLRIFKEGSKEILNRPIQEILKDNTTSSNTTKNSNISKFPKSSYNRGKNVRQNNEGYE